MNSSKSSLKVPNGFTLLELCITMAVIVVLAIVIIPSILSSLKSTRSSMCLSNLRQIGVAISTYASENNQYSPKPGTFGSPPKPTAWMTDLVPYLNMPSNSMGAPPLPRSTGVFICPAYKSRGDRAVCYGLNYYVTDSKWDSRILVVPSTSETILVGELDENTECVLPSNWPNSNSVRRHPNDSSNFLFVDGHSENIRGGIPSTDKRWRWW